MTFKISLSNKDIVGNNANLGDTTRRITIQDSEGEDISIDLEIEDNTLIIYKDSQELSMEFRS